MSLEIGNKQIKQGNLRYEINDQDKTAQIVGLNSSLDESIRELIIIPRSIIYESKEYIITNINNQFIHDYSILYIQFALDSEIQTITNNAFAHSNIKSITLSPHLTKICRRSFYNCQNLCEVIIPENSELQVIEELAFFKTSIESFLITPKVKELQPGFIVKSPKLKKIEVMPGNPYFKTYKNKFLLKKSIENGQEFDFLILATKDVKTVKLPNDIKTIGAYSFENCQQLQKIEVSSDSKLQRIEKFAFYDSAIEWFTIPKSFVDFENGWNSNALKLKKVSVMEGNPNFKLYENNFVLGKTNKENDEFDSIVFVPKDIKIEKVTLPEFIKKIDCFAFDCCQNIKEIEIPENSELQIIDKYAFANSSIEKVSISPSVTEISSYVFTKCENLRAVEIPENSKLEKLGIYAFGESAIEKFTIPPHLTEISDGTFSNCKQLKTVEFHPNSELTIICKEAFQSSSIEKFTIPLHLTEICEKAFEFCNQLQTVETAPNSELRTIGKESFSKSSIQKFTIPPHLTEICDFAFDRCWRLEEIVFPENSELEMIGQGAFLRSALKKFTPPLHLIEIRERTFEGCLRLEEVVIPQNSELRSICKFAFLGCNSLSEVKFSDDSKLETIEEGAFSETVIVNFTIPPHITKIKRSTFSACYDLQEVKTAENSELRSIEDESFNNSSITRIDIPSGFAEFDRKWCFETSCLVNVNISPKNCNFRSYESGLVLGKSNQDAAEFDVLVFCPRNAEKVTIPNFIKIINPYCFDLCNRLLDLDFQNDSKIEIIKDFAFVSCSIQKILIPKNLKKIGEAAFDECKYLKKIMFEENSDIQLIEKSAFELTQIVSFVVPSRLKTLNCNIFSESCIKIIEVKENSELNQFINLEKICLINHNESLIIMIPMGQCVNFLF